MKCQGLILVLKDGRRVTPLTDEEKRVATHEVIRERNSPSPIETHIDFLESFLASIDPTAEPEIPEPEKAQDTLLEFYKRRIESEKQIEVVAASSSEESLTDRYYRLKREADDQTKIQKERKDFTVSPLREKTSNLLTFGDGQFGDRALQDPKTGEMLLPNNDQEQSNYIATGWTFEVVTQSQPRADDLGGPNTNQVKLSPWQFATPDTALRTLQLIHPYIDEKIPLEIRPEDRNERFPTNKDKLSIYGTLNDREKSINCGLLAEQIARSSAYLDGQLKQNSTTPLREAAQTLMASLEHESEG